MNKVRRGQAVAPFGVGAIIDFRGEALMAAGLDYWPDGAPRLQEGRLAGRLAVTEFRVPPSRDAGDQGELPFVRFPEWHFCPFCRTIVSAPWNSPRPPRCASTIPKNDKTKACASLPEKRRPRLAPLRFVVACERGHIDDFPWLAWVHAEEGKLGAARACTAPHLKLISTGRPGMAGLRLECRGCDKKRTLVGAGSKTALAGLGCSGRRPWLGPSATEQCTGTSPVVVQRGASNLYFPLVTSSILIPPYSAKARQLVENPKIWEVLTDGLVNGAVDPIRLQTVAGMRGVSEADLKRAVEQRLGQAGTSAGQDETAYRYTEYTALAAGNTPSTGAIGNDDFAARRLPIDQYSSFTRKVLSNVVLVEKLAETRALIGFSRIEPAIVGGSARVDWNKLALSPKSWVPALRVFGEGIFLQINPDLIARWAGGRRWGDLGARADAVLAARGLPPRGLAAVYFAVHTLAHMLIRRLSFECGYGSSALRERIYYSADPRTAMAGVLIYTAAGDSEGTLGGLVAQGRPGVLDTVLARAIVDAQWCSADPVCGESKGQGSDALNMAACHACALVPETSCEEGNRHLDRAALIGTADGAVPGLVSPILQELMDTMFAA